MDYLALDSEPAYRPKVQKIMVKRYGLRKAVRVATKKNSGVWKRQKRSK